MTVIVTLYWCWFGLSIAILARRLVRKLWRNPVSPTDRGAEDPVARQVVPAASLPRPVVSAPEREPEPSATPPASPPEPRRAPAGGATTTSVADLLAGIAMPADLAPLVHVAGVDAERRVVLSTSGRPAELVDAAVCAELERLGYLLDRTGAAELLAHRGGDTLSLHVRSIGLATASGPADRDYPTAAAGSVVVDVRVR